MASSSSSSSNWVYDVFPSFSGRDVRQRFLSHFLRELDRKLIIAFKDNEIERSHSLDPALKEAIRTSRIAVVVFSTNYASSSWCLNELLEIVKCQKESGQMVIPVFYGLEPTHVRKQTGDFGKIFDKTCLAKSEEETRMWRQALTDVANLLGYHSHNWHKESEMIEAIANDVLGKLNITSSEDFEDFVGLEHHIAKMSVLLDLESEDVRMVGIWGASGIGKTTIARVLYSRISRLFQTSFFIDRAFVSTSMEIFKSANADDYNMKLHLQNTFLSQILDKKDLNIHRLGAVGEKLKHRKSLIFIDDLDDRVVLDTLAGESQWFGCGSRIIVVTKDKHILRAHGIGHIYEVYLPSKDLALEIFCRSAFKTNSPPDGFMELASEVVWHAGKLPLGLNVLGAYLRGRDKEDWVDMLPRLKNGLDGKIEKTLRVSYDGLSNKKDQALFRHIACLFNGKKVNDIKWLLADSNLDVNIGIKNLVDKSLIHVRDGIVVMHNLLQEMGKEIVRAQSNEPGEREFIVDSNDICDVLEDNTGTRNVIGISLDIDDIDELFIHENAFKGMRNLRFLEFSIKPKKEMLWCLPESFDHLPPKLRLLSWPRYPLRRMPSSFRPQNLVKLLMRDSKLEKLWDGVHSLTGLLEMDLTGSENLKEIPNLSMATNLERLYLTSCSSLVELPASIKYLTKLEKLYTNHCVNLETLPIGINLPSLSGAEFFECSRLKIVPNISTNVSYLTIPDTAIDELLQDLPLTRLNTLRIDGDESEKLGERVQRLTPLINIVSPSLRSLRLYAIPSLVEIPSSITKFSELENMEIVRCVNLERIPTGIDLKSLRILDFSECSRLTTFPDISTSISSLYMSGTAIKEVPCWISKFRLLEYLQMNSCSKLEYIHLNISELKHLSTVQFKDCGALTGADLRGYPTEAAVNIEADPVESFLFMIKEKLDFRVPKTRLEIDFSSCFNLDRVLLPLHHPFSLPFMCFPGEEVPSYFTYTTTRGSSSTLTNIPFLHTSLSQLHFINLRFCAAVVLSCESYGRKDFDAKFQFKGRSRTCNDLDISYPYNFKEEGSHLIIWDCCIALNKKAVQLYDRVDIQLQLITTKTKTPLELNGWGVRFLDEDCSSAEIRLGNSNTLPHDEDYVVVNADGVCHQTEQGEDCGDKDDGGVIDSDTDQSQEYASCADSDIGTEYFSDEDNMVIDD